MAIQSLLIQDKLEGKAVNNSSGIQSFGNVSFVHSIVNTAIFVSHVTMEVTFQNNRWGPCLPSVYADHGADRWRLLLLWLLLTRSGRRRPTKRLKM